LADTIGHGEFGDVLMGTYQTNTVAVKVLKQSSGVVEALLDEAALMQRLRHPNLVRFLGVVLDDLTDIFLVLEYLANGNLVDYVRSRGRQAVAKHKLLR
jgi:c-src tyrosine kinase